MAIQNPLDISTYDIADLRRTAAVLKINAEKDWKKEDYITAINTRRKKEVVAKVVYDADEPIPQGFVRIKLPLTMSGSDSAIPVRVNNFVTIIPRNLLVDVPKEIRDQLRSSTECVTREVVDKEGRTAMKTFEVPCQPFEQHGESMGESGAIRPMTDVKEQRIREQYLMLYGKWPRRTSEEWIEFKKSFVKEISDKTAKKASENIAKIEKDLENAA